MKRLFIVLLLGAILITLLSCCAPVSEDTVEPVKTEVSKDTEDEGGSWYWAVYPYFALGLLVVEVVGVIAFWKTISPILNDKFVLNKDHQWRDEEDNQWRDKEDRRWMFWMLLFIAPWVLGWVWLPVAIIIITASVYFTFIEKNEKMVKIKNILLGED